MLLDFISEKMNLPFIFRNKNITRRYKEILKILTKNGFGFISDILLKDWTYTFSYTEKS